MGRSAEILGGRLSDGLGGNPSWSRGWTQALSRCIPALFFTIPMIAYVTYVLENRVPMTNISLKCLHCFK